MKGRIIGRHPAGRSATVIGTWDPFLPDHGDCLRLVQRRCRERDLDLVVAMFEPPPAVHLEAKGGMLYPIYDDPWTRVDCILGAGIPTVLWMDFRSEDIHGTCRDFFDVMCGLLNMGEFWLKPGQTLGRGLQGSVVGVRAECRRRQIGLRHVPFRENRKTAAGVRSCLRNGALQDAICLVGRPPAIRRSEDRIVRRGWRQGLYRAEILGSGAARQWSGTVDLLVGMDGGVECEWPNETVQLLSVVNGPGDVDQMRHCVEG